MINKNYNILMIKKHTHYYSMTYQITYIQSLRNLKDNRNT